MHDIEEFLAMAQQADKAAATAPSSVARNCWKVLAQEYRKLAELQTERPGPTQAPSSP